ncbi:MAG: hypothetical protein O7F74_11180 [Bacteroidetes bacterium]|nr:hypothetical protein [Bacteroidota bacterium]
MQIIENIWIGFIVFLGFYFFLGFLFGLYFVFVGVSNYLLITDKTGSPLHGEILPFVGLNVEMEGEVEQVDDWLVLKVNVNDIVLSTTVNGWFENLLTELKFIEDNEICHIHPTSFISLCY